MIWLGLDLGSRMGWCIHNTTTKKTHWGREDWSKLPRVARVASFGAWLEHMLWKSIAEPVFPLPSAVAFEEVPGGMGSSTWVIQRQEGALITLCEKAEVPYVGVHNAELKRWAAGKGKAKKWEMREAAERWLIKKATERWPEKEAYAALVPPKLDEHEADAVLVCAWAAANVPDSEVLR